MDLGFHLLETKSLEVDRGLVSKSKSLVPTSHGVIELKSCIFSFNLIILGMAHTISCKTLFTSAGRKIWITELLKAGEMISLEKSELFIFEYIQFGGICEPLSTWTAGRCKSSLEWKKLKVRRLKHLPKKANSSCVDQWYWNGYWKQATHWFL